MHVKMLLAQHSAQIALWVSSPVLFAALQASVLYNFIDSEKSLLEQGPLVE